MKFTIEGFSQSKLIEYGLDSRDATFLRWFVDFQATGIMKQHDINDRLHYWIDHKHLADDMPILAKDAGAVQKYLSRFVDKHPDILLSHTERRGDGKTFRGSTAFYAIAPNILESLLGAPEDYDAERPNDKMAYGSADGSISDETTKRQNGGSDPSSKEQEEEGGSCSLIPSSLGPPVESEGEKERTAVALQAAPEASMRVDPEKDPKAPGKNRLTYFNEIHEIATLFANCPPILDAAEKVQAVALAKQYNSTAVLNAWHTYLTKKPGKPFRFFVQDAEQEIKKYMPVKSTQDPGFLEALKHRELIQSLDTEVQPILDGFFESIGGRLTSEGTREDTLRRNGLEDLKPKEASEVPAEETPTIIDAGVELVTA